MKKYRYLFLVFLTAIMSGLYLISCGGDGDGDSGNGGSGDGGQGSTTSSIIGTWLDTSNSDGTEEYTMFCADGTAYIYSEDSYEFEVEKFSYIYNAEKGKIIWIEDDSSDTWSDDIKILTDSKLILETHSGNSIYTEIYKKTTPTYTAAQLENIYKAQSQKSSN